MTMDLAIRQGMREFGYVEAQNLILESRWTNGKHERLQEMADELLRLELDVLVTAFPAAALAAKSATSTVPVVAASVNNPVGMGLAVTLAHPGGNITGISAFAQEVVAQIRIYEASGPDEFEGVFAAMARDGMDALVVLADTNTYTHRILLNDMCLHRRMPSVWPGRNFLTGGGLASYQSDFPAIFRRAAGLVDKNLKGGKPAEIAFEQATKLEMVIDMGAAKALGIAVPRMLLLSADKVIK